MKSFTVPDHYRSPLVTQIKAFRKKQDRLKKDYLPTPLILQHTNIYLARHFGFCYGVEHAIEIAFRAISENIGKRIFLLSEMIHNPQVNADLLAEGVQFLMDTSGNQLFPWSDLTKEDIVIVPAFGTTLEIESQLKAIGIEPARYDTTCPFVEKVWNRSEKIGNDGYTIVVHGKPNHEETRATFSHSKANTPTIVVKDLDQTKLLAQYIINQLPANQFYEDFKGQYSEGFDVSKDLEKIGVVNQTTMLASDTQGIADYLKNIIIQKYNLDPDSVKNHFADTRDTLCYATNDNQSAVTDMLLTPSDLALVIGGYNSSNTSHLVELCEQKVPTYFINHEACISEEGWIEHFDLHLKSIVKTPQFYPKLDRPVNVLITSGASCPDALVERVIHRLISLYDNPDLIEDLIKEFE